jgi:hypothetical protein
MTAGILIRDQYPAAHIFKFRVVQDGLHQPFPESMGTVVLVNEYITKIGKDRVITDDTCHTDLFLAIIDSEDKRILVCAFRILPGTQVCPISAFKKIANRVHIQPLRIGANDELLVLYFKYLWHGASLS